VPAVRFLLAALGIVSIAGLGSSGSGGVQIVYRNPTGPITAFTEDGSLLAWFEPGRHACNAVHVLSLSGVRVTLPRPGTANVTCRWSVGGGPVRLAVAEKTGGALWTLHQRAQVVLDYVVGAAAGEPLERRFDQVAHTPAGAGLWLGGIAGSGSTLVYAVTTVAYVDQVGCLSGGSCRLKLAGGAIHRVVDRHNPVIPGTGPAVAVATAAGRVAYVPASGVGAKGLPVASAAHPIEVVAAEDGTPVARIEPTGVPLGVALAPHVLALIERQAGGRVVVSWYDPLTATLLGSVGVPPKTSSRLAVSDDVIAYRVGRVVYGIAAATGSVHRIVTAPVTPVGFAVEADTLTWAENIRGKGRICTVAAG